MALSLTRRFAAAAGAVVLTACVGLAVFTGENARRDIAKAAEGYNVTLAHVVAKALWDRHRAYLADTVVAGARDMRLAMLDGEARFLLAGLPVLKMKIYGLSATAIYSTQSNEIGTQETDNAELDAALSGRVASSLVLRDPQVTGRGDVVERDVLETYVPVRDDEGQLRGVVEIYHDLTPILAHMRRAQIERWIVLGGTMAVLLGLLVLFVWYSERRTRDANAATVAAQRETDRAQERERLKSEFLANLSHELRSPLNAILGFAQVMQNRVFGPVQPERYEAYVNDIVDSGSYLLRSVDDILDMARIEARQIELLVGTVDLGDLLHRCVRQVGHAMRRPDVDLSVAVPDVPIYVMADENRLRQAFCNVIANAVKFVRGTGTVAVAVMRRGDGGVEVTVRDTGIGIAPDKLATVLTPFGQVAGAYARETGGLGLGLPIAKALIDMHGGTLTIDSTPHVGTTVTFTLPADRVIGATGSGAFQAA